jgi:hypothetical protein
MYRAFFWAASQALEKYLKAFLLMRGVSINRNCFKGHPIVALYHEACSVDEVILTVDTQPHSKINIHPNVSGLIDKLTVDKFLEVIESQGNSDNRYNSSGVKFNSGYLFATDSFVFGLRQLIGVTPIEETLKKMDQYLVEAFNLYNPWFAPLPKDLLEIPNNRFPLRIVGSVTTLDFLSSANAPHEARYVLHWLDKKMKLPIKVKKNLH